MSLQENNSVKTQAQEAAQRLQVFLAHSGIASRRAAEKLIAQGRITVNGRLIVSPGEKVLSGDIICFDGKQVKPESSLRYLALNKPPLYLCSSSDPQGRQLAIDLLPRHSERLYNVGRLDYRSSGLIIFTNDGMLAKRIGHPGFEIEKEYLVESTVPIPEMAIEEFARGVLIEGILYRANQIERTGRNSLRIILLEGKNREIRRVFSHFHLHPKSLTRIRIGPVRLGSLGEGESRPLGKEELSVLMGDKRDNSN